MSKKLDYIPVIRSYEEIRAEMKNDLDYRMKTRTIKTSLGRPLYYRINLQIVMTHECPYNCSFCIERKNPMEGNDDFEAQIESLLSVLAEHPDARLSITGGEPGLYPEHVERLVRVYKRNSNNVFCSINTTGICGEPGYVGYEEGGQLTEKVRRKPYSIVLLDEIEKAHPDVFNVLLQVLDDGQLTDGLGRKVDFKNTIIIMTSNIGTRQLKDFGTGVGFNTAAREAERNALERSVIDKEMKKKFAPEFLNRIDDIVYFNSLQRSDIHKIIDIELKGLFNRVRSMGYNIDLDDKAKDFILKKGWDEQYGARPLKRAIQHYIEDDLADEIIKADILPGDTIHITTAEPSEGNEAKLTFEIEKGSTSQMLEAELSSNIPQPAEA